jgi:hypothetical protein
MMKQAHGQQGWNSGGPAAAPDDTHFFILYLRKADGGEKRERGGALVSQRSRSRNNPRWAVQQVARVLA